MTYKRPEALRLADWIESVWMQREAAAELRRLHEVNAELVEALKDLLGEVTDGYEPHEVFITQAKAALRKAQGENNAD